MLTDGMESSGGGVEEADEVVGDGVGVGFFRRGHGWAAAGAGADGDELSKVKTENVINQ